jgi:hypothetical protein
MAESAQPAAFSIAPRRLVALLVVTLLSLVCAIYLASSLSGPKLLDVDAYWGAAMRLRAGDPLYQGAAAARISGDVYRYAPWFAWAWVPLTYLPRHVVESAWFGLSLSAALYLAWPMRRSRALLLIGPAALESALTGNVQTLMVAGLLFGVERRSGPLWIALAASLKITPIALALVYAGRHEWRRFALTLGLTALLWTPLLWSGLDQYPVVGHAIGHARYPVLFFGLIGVGALASLLLARTRYAWLAASGLALIATPRLFLYQLTLLGVAMARRPIAPSTRTLPGPSRRGEPSKLDGLTNVSVG